MNDAGTITEAFGTILKTVGDEVTSVWLLVQLALIAAAIAIAWAGAATIRRQADANTIMTGWPPFIRNLMRLLLNNIGTIIFVLLVTLAHLTLLTLTWPSRSYLLGVAASLATAWVAIAVVAGLIRNRFVYRLVAVFAWTIAALSIVGLLQPVKTALDSYAVFIGAVRLTPLLLIKTTVVSMLTLWAANAAGDFIDRRVRAAPDLTPSLQVLIVKLARLLLVVFGILFVLSTVGIDLSALALFSGAVGVGLGFGLQKIVSNLVSGIILLTDKSIKPGDVISIGDRVGWVTNMGARYTAVDTKDGREILIPNEDFITQNVVNWSYSNYQMMVKSEFGVSYDSDPHRVIAVAEAAAKSVPRVLADPAPVCYFEAFGDFALNFSLRYWIDDPNNGIITVRAPVMMALWDAFKREGIVIPFPVRDVRITERKEAEPEAGVRKK